jgi:hypothetical protein
VHSPAVVAHQGGVLPAVPEWQLENNKADFMDWLYELYKRDEAEPGLRGTYTGLYERYCMEIGCYWAEHQVQGWMTGLFALDALERDLA